MRALRTRIDWSLAVCALLASIPANASNLHGQLFFHGRPDIEYSSVEDPTGESDLADCQSALTTLETTDETLIWYVMASFPEEISPRATGVQFGIVYDESQVSIVDFGFAEGTTNYRTYRYPSSGENARIYFEEARTAQLFEVAWFAGTSSESASLFAFDPLSTTYFWDDLSPTPVESYGSLGFGKSGEFVCSPRSACCLFDGTCAVLPDFKCEEFEGTLFDDPTCSPGPCLGLTGACCVPEEPERCVMQTRADCDAVSGAFNGLDSVCDPAACELGVCCLDGANPAKCEILRSALCLASGGFYSPEGTDPELCFTYCCCGPILETSWGAVKTRFR